MSLPKSEDNSGEMHEGPNSSRSIGILNPSNPPNFPLPALGVWGFELNGAVGRSRVILPQQQQQCNTIANPRVRIVENKRTRFRTSFTEAQSEELNRAFEITRYPDGNLIDELAKKLNVCEIVVKVWFKNKRAQFKKKDTSGQESTPKLDNSSDRNSSLSEETKDKTSTLPPEGLKSAPSLTSAVPATPAIDVPHSLPNSGTQPQISGAALGPPAPAWQPSYDPRFEWYMNGGDRNVMDQGNYSWINQSSPPICNYNYNPITFAPRYYAEYPPFHMSHAQFLQATPTPYLPPPPLRHNANLVYHTMMSHPQEEERTGGSLGNRGTELAQRIAPSACPRYDHQN